MVINSTVQHQNEIAADTYMVEFKAGLSQVVDSVPERKDIMDYLDLFATAKPTKHIHPISHQPKLLTKSTITNKD